MTEPTTIAEWVERAGERGIPSAEDIAKRQSTADLFRTYAECNRRLSEPMVVNVEARWTKALDAVCEVLGKRVDGAYSRGMR